MWPGILQLSQLSVIVPYHTPFILFQGAVTVPLVLALGLALANRLGATEGFGILAMASVAPINVILAAGLIVRTKCCGGKGGSTQSPHILNR